MERFENLFLLSVLPYEQQGAIAHQELWKLSQALRNTVELLHWVCVPQRDDLSSQMKSFVLCPILQCTVQFSMSCDLFRQHFTDSLA